MRLKARELRSAVGGGKENVGSAAKDVGGVRCL